MKPFILLLFCTICLLPLQAQYNQQLKLAWSEEFNYEGLPDPAVWDYETGYIRNHEAQYYTRNKKNAYVSNGCLVITAHKEKVDTFSYTSASINTLGKMEFFRGRIEVCAKIPTGKGSWPAIWMMGTDRSSVGWPECGEIDIMENVGYDPLRIHATVHTPGSKRDPEAVIRSNSVKLNDAFSAFHVFAVEWYADRLDFFVDEKLILSYRKDDQLPEYWRFDKPHYLLLNLAVGGAWGGSQGIDNSIFPLKYYVDWVRYYN